MNLRSVPGPRMQDAPHRTEQTHYCKEKDHCAGVSEMKVTVLTAGLRRDAVFCHVKQNNLQQMLCPWMALAARATPHRHAPQIADTLKQTTAALKD